MSYLPARSTEGNRHLDALFDCLADADRRRILGTLRTRESSAATPGELVATLVSGSRGASSDEILEDVRVGLHHTHVPKLEAAGLIRRHGDEIALADHPAYDDAGIARVLDDQQHATADSLDALFGALAEQRRRSILDVLSHQFGPIHVETLARELGASEQQRTASGLAGESTETILLSLQHVHLPVLVDADLIAYDRDGDTVSYRGHPDLRVPWMHSVLAPEFRSSLTENASPQDIETIRGREHVVSYGQSLCDRADTELFCLFTQTDMIEAGCLTRIRDAANRGVAVYLGTRDPTVRNYVRENAPAVTLWEPDVSWLNLPVTENTVGRLLLKDRNAVMLGTLHTERAGQTEQAIVGEGDENALVVMTRQLVRPYLDQIDEPHQAFPTTTPP